MSSQQNHFHPTVETLEEREVPASMLGYNTPGMWGAGTERISFFAVDFQGAFNYANAQQAFYAGEAWSVNHNLSLDSTAPITLHTHQGNGAHHLLIGYWNLTEHNGGWIAGDFSTTYQTLQTTGPWYNQHTQIQTHTTMNWIVNNGSYGTNQEGWQSRDWVTRNGYHIDMSLVPLSTGDVRASFSQPYSVAE